MARCGDITLADFWGLEKIRPELLNKDGVSLVLVNNEKGSMLVKSISNRISLCEVSQNEATIQNPNFHEPPKRNDLRENIYKYIFEKGFDSAGKILLPPNAYKYYLLYLAHMDFLGTKVK